MSAMPLARYVFSALSGVDSTRCARTRRGDGATGRRYREAKRNVALSRCWRDLGAETWRKTLGVTELKEN